jgi:hypothetical protein
MLAAVKNKPCGWPLFEQPFLTAPARGGATVCIGRGGGMAPAKQRNAAYSLTPLPTRFLKEAQRICLIEGKQYFSNRVTCLQVCVSIGNFRDGEKTQRIFFDPALFHESFNFIESNVRHLDFLR